MEIILLLFLLVAASAASVLTVTLYKNCSVRDATIICRDCVKNFFGELLAALLEDAPVPERLYPVLVGWDGFRILPQLVDSEFSAVRENFASCYCIGITLPGDNTLVIYKFDIMRRPGSTLDDGMLQQLIQKQSEEILANTMRVYDCYIPAEPLTHTEVFPHALYVAFARNNAGIELLNRRKLKTQRRKALAERPERPPMRERWEDDNGR